MKNDLIWLDDDGRIKYKRLRQKKREREMQHLADFYGCFPRESETAGISQAKDLMEGLEGIFNALCHGKTLDEAALRTAWMQALVNLPGGQSLAQNSHIISLKDGIAKVHVIQPTMRFFMEQNKQMIFRNLATTIKSAGGGDVSGILICHG